MQQTFKIPSTNKPESNRSNLKWNSIVFRGFSFPLSSRSRLNDKAKELFFAEMGMMLKSGIDIHKALTIVASEFEKKVENHLLNRVIEGLVSGHNLSDTMHNSKGFSEIDVSVVRIGENTGLLSDSFSFLADYYSRKIKQRTLVSNAISYPLFVLAFAIIAVGFLLNNVVPIFTSIYQRMEGDIPLVTKIIVNLSEQMPFLVLLLFAISTSILVIAYLYRVNNRVNNALASLFLSTPILKEILMVNFLERFNRVMAMLASAKVPLIDSITLSKDTVALTPIRKALNSIEIGLFAGVPLWLSMENTKFFPRRVISLVKMGEEVNQLDAVFTNLAQQYTTMQEKKLKSIGTYLEPALIVIIGALVGLILIAIYLPMFKLGEQFV